MQPARFVAVINQKGGVGKSTVAQNLSAAAHLRGFKTLLLDLDTQGTSFDWYARRKPDSRLRGLAVQKADRVWTLAQYADFAKGYDFVICDSPGKLSNISAAAAIAADLVIIPMRVGWGEWWAADENEQLLDRADEVREQLGRGRVRRVYVLNEVKPNVSETKAMVDALAGNVELLPTWLHSRVTYDRARGVGEATITFEPNGAASKEVTALYEAVINAMERGHGEGATVRARKQESREPRAEHAGAPVVG